MIISLAFSPLSFASKAEAFTPDKKALEACRAKLKAAQKLDLLYQMEMQADHTLLVVVGPTYSQIDFDARENFAKTISCFILSGDTASCANFDLLDYMTHNRVARFSYCHLTSE